MFQDSIVATPLEKEIEFSVTMDLGVSLIYMYVID